MKNTEFAQFDKAMCHSLKSIVHISAIPLFLTLLVHYISPSEDCGCMYGAFFFLSILRHTKEEFLVILLDVVYLFPDKNLHVGTH